MQVFARSWSPAGPLLVLLEIVYSITDPPIKALRRVIPPLRLGSVALDLSFLIVLIAAYLLLVLNDADLLRGVSCAAIGSLSLPADAVALLFGRAQYFRTTSDEWVRSCR